MLKSGVAQSRVSAALNEIDGSAADDRLFGLSGRDEIDGGAGNDQIFGGQGADDLDGERGNDSLFGGAGNDLLNGGSGDDLLTGGEGNDIFEFYRSSGRDTITDFTNGQDRLDLDGLGRAAVEALIAGARQIGSDTVLDLGGGAQITLQNFRVADLDLADFVGFGTGGGTPPTPQPSLGRDIDGTNGADRLIGTAGRDDMDGRGGDDEMRGGAGADDMDGGAGNDSLWGEAGRDDMDGGRGNDRLVGGAGHDTLDGGRGNDVLTGGEGADRFEFARSDGRDIITDFTNGIDRIELDGFTARELGRILASATQQGQDVVLTLSATASLTLQDVQLSMLDRSDFLL